MKKLIFIPFILFLAGCTSFTTSVRKSEMAAVHTGIIAMQGWAMYYKASTNGADTATLAALNVKRDRFNKLSIKLGTAAQLVDTMLASYKTNGVGKVDVQGTLSLLASNAAVITFEVKEILAK